MTKIQKYLNQISLLEPRFDSVSFMDILRVSPYNIHQIKSSNRKRELVRVRKVLAVIAYKEQLGLERAGEMIGRDHVTVSYSLREMVNTLSGYDPDFKKYIDELLIQVVVSDHVRSADEYVDSLIIMEQILARTNKI